MEQELFEKAPVSKAYFKMALPVVMSMLVSLVYNMVDTWFIAQTQDTALVAGVSLCAPMFTLMVAMGDIFGLGGSSLLSRLLGKGEEMTGGRERRSILADAFEALIAAIFLDGGMDEAQKFIMKFVPSIEAIKSGKVKLGDYKTILQEIIQQNPEEHISYEVTEEEGEAHHKTFTADVMLNGQSIGTGSGQSKKEAEQAAAKEAIGLMGYETD